MEQLQTMSLAELWQLFPVVLREHNHDYAAWYQEEKSNLSAVLKAYDIFRINHIGSTVIEGLIAKPIVDILLEFKNGYDSNEVMAILNSHGWIVMAQDVAANGIDLNKGYTPYGFAEKVYHLHIKVAGDWGQLYFRDYLQIHREIAKQYGELKLSLQEKFEYHRDDYTAAKSEFIQLYTEAARTEFNSCYAPVI